MQLLVAHPRRDILKMLLIAYTDIWESIHLYSAQESAKYGEVELHKGQSACITYSA